MAAFLSPEISDRFPPERHSSKTPEHLGRGSSELRGAISLKDIMDIEGVIGKKIINNIVSVITLGNENVLDILGQIKYVVKVNLTCFS